MDPISIIAAAIGIAGGLIRIAFALNEWWEKRKQRRAQTDPIRALVAEQDPQEREHERLVKALETEAKSAPAATTSTVAADSAAAQALQAKAAALQRRVEQRDAAIAQQMAQAAAERKRWQEMATHDMKHLTLTPEQLAVERNTMRSAFRTLPEVDPASQRFVVVIGPAGTGKSSLIAHLLKKGGYEDLCTRLASAGGPCSIGTGTKDKPAPYILDKHGVLLLDSVGNAAANVGQGEAMAADTLVVLLGIHCRAEQITGDAAVIAYRLQHHMHTVFVVPHADLEFPQHRSTQSAEETVATMQRKAMLEVQHILGYKTKDSSVVARAAKHQPSLTVDPGVRSLLDCAQEMNEDEWCEWMQGERWVSFVCLGGLEPAAASVLQPQETAALQQELARLEARVLKRVVRRPLPVPRPVVLPLPVPAPVVVPTVAVAVSPATPQVVAPPVRKVPALFQLKQSLQGHMDSVSCCAISPDGRTLVSGSWDTTLKVWDLASGSCRQTLQGHTDSVRCCAISPDGNTLVSGSDDETLKVWDLATGSCMQTLQGHTKWVNCCAISPDGRTLVSGSFDHTLKVWDLASGSWKQTLQGHTTWVECCAISPDGNTLVSGSGDKTIEVWDLASGSCRQTLQGHSLWVYCCAISPDGRTLVSGGWDSILRVWDLDTGSCRQTLEGHEGVVYCCAISPDGNTLVSGSLDETLKLWDLATGNCRRTLEGHTRRIICCAISPDGCTLVSGSDDKTLMVWDLATGSCRQTLQGGTDHVRCCAISPDGNTLVSGSSDKTLKVWSAS